MLYGSGEQEPQTELTAQLAQEFYNQDMLVHLVENLPRLDFEVTQAMTQCMCLAGADIEGGVFVFPRLKRTLLRSLTTFCVDRLVHGVQQSSMCAPRVLYSLPSSEGELPRLQTNHSYHN